MKKILFVLPLIVGFIIGYLGLHFCDQKGAIEGKVLSSIQPYLFTDMFQILI
ncbi:hypothetical protein KKB40_02880 [Patescibacteria group bacterium]|nr:hypothetical protein [Patescibacteria group bacterium]